MHWTAYTFSARQNREGGREREKTEGGVGETQWRREGPSLTVNTRYIGHGYNVEKEEEEKRLFDLV